MTSQPGGARKESRNEGKLSSHAQGGSRCLVFETREAVELFPNRHHRIHVGSQLHIEWFLVIPLGQILNVKVHLKLHLPAVECQGRGATFSSATRNSREEESCAKLLGSTPLERFPCWPSLYLRPAHV
eukprot:GHVT01053637.1.p2 GENE.GHVT01053637.1~~GHVT01053637.1.p2  ORF type:complete len:128 (+),score=6.04 GHVT01053637.1:74-457(+)